MLKYTNQTHRPPMQFMPKVNYGRCEPGGALRAQIIPHPTPRPLMTDEIPEYMELYATAAKNQAATA